MNVFFLGGLSLSWFPDMYIGVLQSLSLVLLLLLCYFDILGGALFWLLVRNFFLFSSPRMQVVRFIFFIDSFSLHL